MSIIDRLLKFAGKDNFQLDYTIGVGYILRQCWKYGWMMVRGRFFSIGYNQIANSVFIGIAKTCSGNPFFCFLLDERFP